MVIISGPKIYAEQGILKNSALVIQKNKIQEILTTKKNSDATVLTFPENYHLVPGFIDVHVHGANGSDVMDGDFSALKKMSQALAAEGTTSFLATTMTAGLEEMDHVLQNVHEFMLKQHTVSGAKILGVHLEGPFLSPTKVGAQRADKILAPNIEYFERWQKKSGNSIKLITIAPELPESISFIRYLKTQNIVASIGHTDATYAESIAAIEAGCTHVTHLYNAMRGMHQREPGVVTAALLSDQISAELIVDGTHLHPAIVKLALKVKGSEKIILVTDAMRAKCLSDGIYDLGGQSVEVKNNIAQLADGTLAGSTLKMSSALQNMMRFTGCDLFMAVKCASENPARTLNVFDKKGGIAEGKDADLVVLDDNLDVVLTMSLGEVVYRRE
ncbi:MAG: N-acetylglucosamine-6-phosphate deacetylase [Gammaproteobacteria bacterium]